MYEELTFQIKDDKVGWYTRQILDMDPDGQMILLGDSWVPLNTIASIKLNRKRVWPNIIGGALQVGGISMFMGDLWFTVTNQPQYSEGGMEFGLINFGVGTIIRALFSPIVYDLGKRKRLRVVDLTFLLSAISRQLSVCLLPASSFQRIFFTHNSQLTIHNSQFTTHPAFHSSGLRLNPLPTRTPLQGLFLKCFASASAFAFFTFHSSLFTGKPIDKSRQILDIVMQLSIDFDDGHRDTVAGEAAIAQLLPHIIYFR